MQVVKINWVDSHIMYNLCHNNMENIEKLSNENVTFKCDMAVNWGVWCKIKTKEKTIYISDTEEYLIGINCFWYPELYKQKHFNLIK